MKQIISHVSVFYRANEVRGTVETFGAPERIVEVSAVSFEFRRQAAVNHRYAAGFTQEI